MLIPLLHALRWIPLAGTAASIAYCVVATFAAFRFAGGKRNTVPASNLPRISILKPLKGDDPGLYVALRSHCVQDYPEYEILCGVTDANDPAIAVVGEITRDLPLAKLRLVQCGKRLGTNGKVSTLIQLAEAASNEVLVVSDSDIAVEATYLRTLMGELQEPDVGLVTCLYRATPAETLGSRLEALGIYANFVPGVLTAHLLEGGLKFGLGSTLAFRKADLEAIGGFAAIADYLADDYELGHRIASLGRKVRLSSSIVETHLPRYDFAGFWTHQLRWLRTIRASRPGGYAGLLVTYTWFWTLAMVLVRPNLLSWMLFIAALFARGILVTTCLSSILRERKANLDSSFILHEFLAPVLWLAGWFGNSITWRGEKFELKNGKLTRK